ncbi:MAG: hypothetical protein JNL83_22285 [Myxococcales bacterium]|nr:hypothetical protein [Myxococcales bacterium]
MFLFRSLTIGLLGACILLLARLEGPAATVSPGAAVHAAPAATAATIVDVAPGVRASDVPSLIRLAPGERVVAVDDRRVDSDLAAGVAIANRAPASGAFVDLDIAGTGGAHRRVLVLLH